MPRNEESLSLSVAKAIRNRLLITPATIQRSHPDREDENISFDVAPDPLQNPVHDGHGANFIVELSPESGVTLRRRVIVTEL